MLDLMKAIDRSGLIQVRRTVHMSDGTTFERMQWVLPSQVKSTDTVVGKKPDINKDKAAPQNKPGMSTEKQHIVDLLQKFGRDSVLKFVDSCGIKYNKNSNVGINWMRCSMALNKHMKENPSFFDSIDIKSGSLVPPSGQPSNNVQKPQQSQQVSTSKKSTAGYDKNKVRDVANSFTGDKLFDALKNGDVTWKESSNAPINRMRALMALGKASEQDSSIFDKLTQASQGDTKSNTASRTHDQEFTDALKSVKDRESKDGFIQIFDKIKLIAERTKKSKDSDRYFGGNRTKKQYFVDRINSEIFNLNYWRDDLNFSMYKPARDAIYNLYHDYAKEFENEPKNTTATTSTSS